MASNFKAYAQYYDLIYRDKDYRGEAAFVDQLLQAQWPGRARAELTLLDLACGTGRHSRELAQLGYRLEGSDLSAEMIAIAREEAEAAGLAVSYHTESFQTCGAIPSQFDAVMAMFSAIDYLTDHRDFAQTLRHVRQLLKPEGVLVFDFWNGNAVIKDYSPRRVRSGEGPGLSVTRTSNTQLDLMQQRATVQFDFEVRRAAGEVERFSETHVMRYYFPQEMQDLLAAHGYEVLKLCPFLAPEQTATPEDWNLTVVARPRTAA